MSERTLTASWHEDDTITEVTANLGPRGGLSSPGERQGLQYRHYNQVSDVVQTGVIRADGMVHITTMPGGDPETVHDKEAAERIYRDLGSAALVFMVPAPAMNSVPGSSNRPQNGLRLTRVSTDQKQHERPRAGSRYGAVVYQSLSSCRSVRRSLRNL